MHCEDNGKLRTPLNEVCMTTDIGCVPIVNGKPTCKPQPDELPIAYDKSTSTLWLFSCDTREWVAHKKFTMEELQDLNLENLNNICSILKIGVFYNPGTGTIQGNVSLGEFAEQLLKCLDLETKVVTITQGENNTIKISIEGLDGLPPTYVKGDNVWFTGTGTEGDPIIVHTYDPICKWPVASQSVVDAAAAKHLGACLDGQPSRVPYPPKPCEYSQKTQEEVDAAASKNLIACVDGEAVKVPYPKYQPPVCEADQLTLEQASAAGSNLTILGCEDNSVVRIPVSGSGFFDRDYICVPTVITAPTDAPLSGTGPLRIGCNGELYVWICGSEGTGHWEEVRYNMNSLSTLNSDSVADLCDNFRMMGWYSNISGDPCVEQVKLTLRQLVHLLKECDICCPSVYVLPVSVGAGGGCGTVGKIIGPTAGEALTEPACFDYSKGMVTVGESTVTADTEDAYVLQISARNPFNVTSLCEIEMVGSVRPFWQRGAVGMAIAIAISLDSVIQDPITWPNSIGVNNFSSDIQYAGPFTLNYLTWERTDVVIDEETQKETTIQYKELGNFTKAHANLKFTIGPNERRNVFGKVCMWGGPFNGLTVSTANSFSWHHESTMRGYIYRGIQA